MMNEGGLNGTHGTSTIYLLSEGLPLLQGVSETTTGTYK